MRERIRGPGLAAPLGMKTVALNLRMGLSEVFITSTERYLVLSFSYSLVALIANLDTCWRSASLRSVRNSQTAHHNDPAVTIPVNHVATSPHSHMQGVSSSCHQGLTDVGQVGSTAGSMASLVTTCAQTLELGSRDPAYPIPPPMSTSQSLRHRLRRLQPPRHLPCRRRLHCEVDAIEQASARARGGEERRAFGEGSREDIRGYRLHCDCRSCRHPHGWLRPVEG